jgi:hypothetical protein
MTVTLNSTAKQASSQAKVTSEQNCQTYDRQSPLIQLKNKHLLKQRLLQSRTAKHTTVTLNSTAKQNK